MEIRKCLNKQGLRVEHNDSIYLTKKQLNWNTLELDCDDGVYFVNILKPLNCTF